MNNVKRSYQAGMLDITMCGEVEIKLSQLHKNMDPVLHVNTAEGCVLRICMIHGNISVINELIDKSKVVVYSYDRSQDDNQSGDVSDQKPEGQIL